MNDAVFSSYFTQSTFKVYVIAYRSSRRRSDVEKTPICNAIFRGIIATERCCFAQLLKVVHSVSDRCFFAPGYGKLSCIVHVNVASV